MLLHLITRIQSTLYTFHLDERGLTMVEYAVAGSLVTLGCALAFTDLGTAIAEAINAMKSKMKNA